MTGRLSATWLAALATLASATALSSLYSGGGWLLPLVAAVLVAATCGALARRLRVPAAASPVLSLLGLVAFVELAYCAGTTFLLVPTGRTVAAVHNLVSDGFADVHSLASPVPSRRGVVLLGVLGVFAVAVVVDLLAATLRRPALAGLPLLSLFAVPAAVSHHGVGSLPFLLGSAGFVALLLADGQEQVGRWGRPLGPRTAPMGRPGPADSAAALLGATGRRIGVAAVGAAILVPVAVPGLGSGLLAHDRTGVGGGGTGHGTSASVVSPLVSVSGQLHDDTLVPELTVQTPLPSYLRLTALDAYSDGTFVPGQVHGDASSRVRNGLPAAPGSSKALATTTVTSHVRVASLAEHYLPVPYAPTAVSVKGDWRSSADTLTVFSTRSATRSGQRYDVTAALPVPSAEQLREAGRALPTAALPATAKADAIAPGLPPAVAQLALRTVGRATDEYDRVVAVQTLLRSKAFAYSLTNYPTGPDALTDFLFTRRSGYCEQFAGSMVLMLRSLGIPARVAVGFTGGHEVSAGTYQVTNRDAHAWPEVFFPTLGWIPFEPTTRDNAAPPGYAAASSAPGTTPAPASALPSPPANGIRGMHGVHDPNEAPGPAVAPVPTVRPGGAPGRRSAGAGLLVLALLVAPGLARLRQRRRRLAPGPGPGPGPGPSGPDGRHGHGGARLPAGRVAARRWHRRAHPGRPATPPGRPATPPGTGPLTTASLPVRRGASAVGAWTELLASACDLGLVLRANESPRATVSRLARAMDDPSRSLGGGGAPERAAIRRVTRRRPAATGAGQDADSAIPVVLDRHRRESGAVEAMRRLAGAVEQARYCAHPAPVGDLAADVRTARRGLARSVPVRRRLRAVVAPPSVLAAMHGRLSVGTADALDELDRVVARVGAVVRRVPGAQAPAGRGGA